MDNPVLTQYVKSEKEQGMPPKFIYQKSLESGWSKEAIVSSFRAVYGNKTDVWDFTFESFSGLMEKSIRFLADNFKLLITINTVPAALVIIFFILEMALFPGVPAEKVPPVFRFLTGPVIWIAQFMASGATLYAIINHGNGIEAVSAYKGVLAKLKGYVWTSLMETVIAMVGFMLLILPGFIFFMYSMFSLMVFFSEDLSGWKAIKRSFFYVRGFVLKIVSRTFAFGIFIGLVELIVGFLVNINQVSWLSRPATAILQIFTLSFSPIYLYFIYLRVKEIKTVLAKIDETKK